MGVALSQPGRAWNRSLEQNPSLQLQDSRKRYGGANLQLGFKADLRDYGVGAQILVQLGLHRIRLITNNPRKIVGIEGYGLKVVGQVPIEDPSLAPPMKNISARKGQARSSAEKVPSLSLRLVSPPLALKPTT